MNPIAALAAGILLVASIIALAMPSRAGDPRIATTDVREVCRSDGLPGSAYSRAHRVVARRPVPGHQVDHVVPLCLGGADVDANIQVQPIEEALQKDELERAACRAVCAGRVPLAEAQAWFTGDWRAHMRSF